MKRILCLLVALVLALAVTPIAGAEEPPTLEEQIEDSVVLGLDWLAGQANPNGSFGGWHTIAHTGLVVLKFEDRAIDLGLDPLSEEYEYHGVVQAGLDNIETYAVTQPIGVEPAGNPDGNGNGIGIHWSEEGTPSIYATGIAMMALAASQHPELYGVLLQDAVDYMSWAQVDEGCPGSEAVHRGGWRYGPNQCTSDNSTSGYATLGLGFAGAAPPFGFGLTVPEFVVDELDQWIGVIQDPVDGDDWDGGSYYDPQWPDYVNILKTGNLLYEMGLVGDTVSAARVQDAVDYIERMWTNADPEVGWIGHRQAMFTMMKGLESLGIELLDLDGVEPLDEWFPIVAQHLIDTQNPDGSWPNDYFADEILSTAWALLTLEKAVPTFEVPVPVDIKPGSDPNSINCKNEKNNIAVAVLTTDDFDAISVDHTTVIFEGASETHVNKKTGEPRRHEDDVDGDGDIDLVFHLRLGDTSLTCQSTMGTLIGETYDGTPIEGSDSVRMVNVGACGATPDSAGASCQDIRDRCPGTPSGDRWITPDGTTAILAYCHMDEEGNGWTLIYNRNNAYFSPDHMYHELPAQGPDFSANSTSWFIPNDATRWRWEVSVDSGPSYRTLETSIPPEARATTHATVEDVPIGTVYENTTGASGPFYFQTIVFPDRCLYGCDSGVASWWGIVNVSQGAGDQDNPGLGGHTDSCSLNSMLLPGDNYTWGDGDLELYLSDWKDIGGDGIGGTNCVPDSPTTQYRYRFWTR